MADRMRMRRCCSRTLGRAFSRWLYSTCWRNLGRPGRAILAAVRGATARKLGARWGGLGEKKRAPTHKKGERWLKRKRESFKSPSSHSGQTGTMLVTSVRRSAARRRSRATRLLLQPAPGPAPPNPAPPASAAELGRVLRLAGLRGAGCAQRTGDDCLQQRLTHKQRRIYYGKGVRDTTLLAGQREIRPCCGQTSRERASCPFGLGASGSPTRPSPAGPLSGPRH